MKRILLIFLLIFPVIVKAETFYGDYYLKEENISEYKEESDILKRKEKKLFHSYQLERNDLGYFELDNNFNYELYDENDFIEEKSISQNYSDNSTYNILFRNDYNNYTLGFKIIFDTYSNDDYLKNFKVYYDNDLILEKNINDYIKNYQEVDLFFSKKYEIDKIKIKYEIDSKTNHQIVCFIYNYGLNLVGGTNFYSYRYYHYSNSNMYVLNFINYKLFKEYTTKNIPWYNENYTGFWAYYYENITKKYLFYEFLKKYSDNYYEIDSENYYLDYDDYKIVYDYYIKDYLIVSDIFSDNLIIDTKLNLNDIKVSYQYNVNEVLVIFKFKDKSFYKKYELNNNVIEKEINSDSTYKIRNITENEVAVQEDIITQKVITTTKIKENITINSDLIKCKEEKNNKQHYVYILIVLLFLLSTLYIFKTKNK